MFRNERYFNKNDGQHNYFGLEQENLDNLNLKQVSGQRKPISTSKKPPSLKQTSSPKRKSG